MPRHPDPSASLAGRRVVFLHSSDELYGADRILLALLDHLPAEVQAEVWLPTDVVHSSTPLCAELSRRAIAWRHIDLPVLRRAYRRPGALLRLGARWVRLVHALRQARPNLVYCTTSAVLPGALAARVAGVRRVAAHVQELWSNSDRRVLGPLARTTDRLLAISPAVAAALPASLQARTHVLLNATGDPGPVEPLAGRTGPLQYLVASRWNGWKGHRTLLEAWAAAGSPGHLTVLGAMPGSGAGIDVAGLVARLSDPGSVTIAGEVYDIASYVRAADVVVVPSDLPEPFGLVAIEALAAGRPVIASAAGGLADIVGDGEGWLFPRCDVEALCRVLTGLDRAEVERAGAAARAGYEARFTMARYAHQWREELAQLWPSPDTTARTR